MAPPVLDSRTIGRKPPKFYDFHTFAEPGFPVSLTGAFRDNIRQFIHQCATPVDYSVEDMPVWCTFLVYESRGMVLPLFTVEENVEDSDDPFCDYCRCVGWSDHFVSKRKYHLIIPAIDEWNKPLDDDAFDLQTHLLHGLIHCNGFGHLLCVNGIEGGSKYICGTGIMDLWDRICTFLNSRQISVEDLSKKRGMDLRLLYGVGYGSSWFGKWGYRFFHGSYGVKEHNYEKAVEILSSLELDRVIEEFNFTNGCSHIKQMIYHYRDLSETDLVTIRDLFGFMLGLKHRSPATRKSASSTKFSLFSGKSTAFVDSGKTYPTRFITRHTIRNKVFSKDRSMKFRNFSKLACKMDSRWPVRRLEQVAEVVVEALKEKKAATNICSCGMSRQEARDAARLHIGDTGLIDHVLKALNNVIVGKYVVRRSVNRITKVLEYTLLDLSFGKEPDVRVEKRPVLQLSMDHGRNIHDDVSYLYKNVLLNYPGSDQVKQAVRTVLHSKHFLKDWPFRDELDDSLRFTCRLERSSFDIYAELSREFPVMEYVVLPVYATLGDLKIAVQNAMRDTYCVMENFQVMEIMEMEEVTDEEVLFGQLESGMELRIRGCGVDLQSELRYEGGAESWIVRCKCGARDDDGERMVSCDICETWQHTHCSGIEDSEAVPRLFVCDSCCSSLAPEKQHNGFEVGMDSNQFPLLLLPQFPEPEGLRCTEDTAWKYGVPGFGAQFC